MHFVGRLASSTLEIALSQSDPSRTYGSTSKFGYFYGFEVVQVCPGILSFQTLSGTIRVAF